MGDPDHDLVVRVKTLVEQVVREQDNLAADAKELRADIKIDLAKVVSRMAAIETKQAVMDTNCSHCSRTNEELRVELNKQINGLFEYIDKEIKAVTDAQTSKDDVKEKFESKKVARREFTLAQMVAIAGIVAAVVTTILVAILD